MENQEQKNESLIGVSGLNAGLGWPTPKPLPSIINPFDQCRYYAENGLLYINDGGGEQNLIGSFRIAGRSAEQEKKIADFAARCMNRDHAL